MDRARAEKVNRGINWVYIVVGVIAGVALLAMGSYLWGVIAFAAGGLLFLFNQRSLKRTNTTGE
ncbi:hypothetical protein GOEFS_064_00170 [Gordonia effusa NBRC 100432]|uniref:Uncharacterized protein n=1 Tax=Gordonia effusa NBRC 100432 TaxID=1077974 RepID=H0R127_9ACTN|nr:hypothetical protein [Gordonia effusa]GAB18778.1 hypothetical protein GOEFS_064_00170 [Gordonia effusa NBRC 100432]